MSRTPNYTDLSNQLAKEVQFMLKLNPLVLNDVDESSISIGGFTYTIDTQFYSKIKEVTHVTFCKNDRQIFKIHNKPWGFGFSEVHRYINSLSKKDLLFAIEQHEPVFKKFKQLTKISDEAELKKSKKNIKQSLKKLDLDVIGLNDSKELENLLNKITKK